MKEKKLYECDFCHTSYAKKLKAKKCEENHKKIKKITDTRYLPINSDSTGKPDKICVELEDGEKVWYKR